MNLLDDIIMDKVDRVIKIVVVVISFVVVGASVGGQLKTNAPRVKEMADLYIDGKELLEELEQKQPQFNSTDVVYGYVVYLSTINGVEDTNVERVKAICSDEENKSLENVASELQFEISTTEEELTLMEDKQYALERFGLENYTIIYNIVQAHLNDF